MHMTDLEYLDIGSVFDIITESSNDSAEYTQLASQEDMDNF